MEFNQKIHNEYASIRGVKLVIDDGYAMVEDLIAIDGQPYVILSNDDKMSLMDALNTPVYHPNQQQQGGGHQQEASVEQLFPGVKYTEDGIPIMDSIATTEADMELAERNTTGKGMHQPQRQQLAASPLTNLLMSAKKDTRKITLQFHVSTVSNSLYEVLKDSYPDENIDEILGKMISNEIAESMVPTIAKDLSNILNSPIEAKPPAETNNENSKDNTTNGTE